MLECVPQELKDLKQWVCAYHGSKAPQKPFEYGGASTTDPSTWGDFDTACAAVEQDYYDYAGFVFADNGIVGIDIDTGFDESGLPTPEAMDILTRCHSYTELSRSGRGYHIFLRGQLPFDGQNNGQGIEIYKTKRYFIMTGKRVLYDAVIENQEAIDYVVERFFSASPVPVGKAENPQSVEAAPKIYCPRWNKPDDSGRCDLAPVYPEITPGSRHISMVSLAGQLRSAGYGNEYIYSELLRANASACKPPLPTKELQQIVRSMRRYDR